MRAHSLTTRLTWQGWMWWTCESWRISRWEWGVSELSLGVSYSAVGIASVFPGAVLASASALVLTMVVVASYAFAQFLGLGLPALLGSNPSYSSPPAILALGLSTAFMLVGAALSFKTSRRRTQRRDW